MDTLADQDFTGCGTRAVAGGVVGGVSDDGELQPLRVADKAIQRLSAINANSDSDPNPVPGQDLFCAPTARPILRRSQSFRCRDPQSREDYFSSYGSTPAQLQATAKEINLWDARLSRSLAGVRGCRHAGTLFYHRAKREADFLREMTQESQPGSSNDKKAEHRIAFGQRFAILPTDLMI